MATWPLPFQNPHSGEKGVWLYEPCLLRVPTMGKNEYGCTTPTFSGSLYWGGMHMAA